MKLGLFNKVSLKELIYQLIRDNAGDGMLVQGQRQKPNQPDKAIIKAIRIDFPKKNIAEKKIASIRKKINRGKFSYESITRAAAPAIAIPEYNDKGQPKPGTTGIKEKKAKVKKEDKAKGKTKKPEAKVKTVVIKKVKKSTPARTVEPEPEVEQE